MSDFYVAGNWKLNLAPQQASEFCAEFIKSLTATDLQQCILFPSAISVDAVCKASGDSALQVGGQNAYVSIDGAFTGENSARMFKQVGCQWLLIAHSERRQLFAEDNATIKEKLKVALAEGLRPLLCIGETLEKRESGETGQVLAKQLEVLKGHQWDSSLAIAYEPVWAIGTGKVASVSQVDETHAEIRKLLEDIQPGYGQSATLLYGGSVKPESARELSSLKNVNGFLVGGASLKPESFAQIVSHSRHRFS